MQEIQMYEVIDLTEDTVGLKILYDYQKIKTKKIQKRITEITLAENLNFSSIQAISCLKDVRRLTVTTYNRDNILLDWIHEKLPSLEEIIYTNTMKVYFVGDKTLQHELVVRITSENLSGIDCGWYSRMIPPLKNLQVVAPTITPGRVTFPIRYAYVRTFIEHPDWYTEGKQKSINSWVLKNADSFLTQCLKEKQEDLVVHFLNQENAKFPAKVYDHIVEAADDDKHAEIKALALTAKNRYYDIEKLNRRAEAAAMKDMEDPLRAHAMRKLWSWSIMDDKTVFLKAFKGELSDLLLDGVLEVPSVIADKVVYGVEGPLINSPELRKAQFQETICEITGTFFAGASALEEVIFDGKLPGIPRGCFQGCPKLSMVSLNGNDMVIGKAVPMTPKASSYPPFLIDSYAFNGCQSLKALCLNNVCLATNVFSNSGLTSVTLRNVPQISYSCFADCKELKEVDIQGTAVIESLAFKNSGITDLHVSDHLCAVDKAFDNCPDFKRVHLHHVKSAKRIKALFPSDIQNKLQFIVDEP